MTPPTTLTSEQETMLLEIDEWLDERDPSNLSVRATHYLRDCLAIIRSLDARLHDMDEMFLCEQAEHTATFKAKELAEARVGELMRDNVALGEDGVDVAAAWHDRARNAADALAACKLEADIERDTLTTARDVAEGQRDALARALEQVEKLTNDPKPETMGVLWAVITDCHEMADSALAQARGSGEGP